MLWKKLKLEGNRWLWEMFAIRNSWISTFFRDKLMFGLMRTLQGPRTRTTFLVSFTSKVIRFTSFIFVSKAMDKQRYENARLN